MSTATQTASDLIHLHINGLHCTKRATDREYAASPLAQMLDQLIKADAEQREQDETEQDQEHATNAYPVCTHCGSENVTSDACATWNKQTRRWEMSTVYDNTDCQNCEGETRLKWIEPGQA